jgi:hypothetical protein
MAVLDTLPSLISDYVLSQDDAQLHPVPHWDSRFAHLDQHVSSPISAVGKESSLTRRPTGGPVRRS